jgi:hypothetical protein
MMAAFEIAYPDGEFDYVNGSTHYQVAMTMMRDRVATIHDLDGVPPVRVTNLDTGSVEVIEGELLTRLIYLDNHCPDEPPESEEEGQWQNEKSLPSDATAEEWLLSAEN